MKTWIARKLRADRQGRDLAWCEGSRLMADMKGLSVGILIRIGDGKPNEIAETSIPLQARLAQDNFNGAFIEIDWESLHEGLRDALHQVADRLPSFEPSQG